MTGGGWRSEMQTFAGRTIDVPSMFVAGASDWGIYQKPGDFEAMQARACTRMTGCHIVDGAGHWVQQERPDAVAELLLAFLATVLFTGRGIALEELKGIRDRIRFRKPQRNRMGSWGFDQLRQFIAYKAESAGVLLKIVDPKYTSQMCSQCEHVERGNRSSRSRFCCKQCGHQAHADCNAARNIRARALVNMPKVSATPALAAG
jgi:IS605 OrfB family transposase